MAPIKSQTMRQIRDVPVPVAKTLKALNLNRLAFALGKEDPGTIVRNSK